jgi:chemotaxis protein CheD
LTFPNPDNLPVEYLKPGEILVSDHRLVVTVLGSCVSVTLFDPRRRIGGILHAMLPKRERRGRSEDFRYVDEAFPHLLSRLEREGASRGVLEVKLFGGGDLLESGRRTAAPSVGRRNIEACLSLLERERLALESSSVGGPFGRKVVFNTRNGHVFLKHLPRMAGAEASISDRKRPRRGLGGIAP